MTTKYQPVSTDGRKGPLHDYLTTASIWVCRQPDPHAWNVELVHDPLPSSGHGAGPSGPPTQSRVQRAVHDEDSDFLPGQFSAMIRSNL